jgi:hypothetical protein
MVSHVDLSVGLWIGDSFAEATVLSRPLLVPSGGGKSDAKSHQRSQVESHALLNRRWWLSRRSLGDGIADLKSAIETESPNFDLAKVKIHAAFSRRHRLLQARPASPIAMLVTSGFEQLVLLGHDFTNSGPSLNNERAWFPIGSDYIFGVTERTLADGSISITPELIELEFICTKLNLLKIEHVAVGFLHSDIQPENESRTVRYLLEKGFKVHPSSECGKLNEIERWKACAIEAYYAASIEEDMKASLAAFTSWNLVQPVKIETDFTPHAASPLLHFGLESFQSIAPLAQKSTALPIQPTQSLAVSTWQAPSWSDNDKGFEPGPMIFGKSQNLTTVDLLFAGGNLDHPIDGVSDRIQTKAKARPRVLDTIFALGKDMDKIDNHRTDAEKLLSDLELTFADRISAIVSLLPQAENQRTIQITGALAPSVINLLSKRRPDLNWSLSKNYEWYLPTTLAKAAENAGGET